MRHPHLLVCALLAASSTAAVRAQDPMERLAERLKTLIDRRIEELRVELHREIDAALGSTKELRGLTTRPVSDEFRELYRLPQGCGLFVESLEGEGWSIRPRDVILGVAGKPVFSPSDLARAVASGPDVLIADVVRKGERQLLIWESPVPRVAHLRSADGPTETADEMLDRLWQKALKNTVENGIEPVSPQNLLPESHPAGNFPIPRQEGRR